MIRQIYEITNLINGKRYFGQTRQKRNTRWLDHKGDARRGKLLPLYNSMRKYGVENFQYKVIIDNIPTQSELDRLEKLWIETCNTTDREFGYNIDKGGSGGSIWTEERKLAYSKSQTGNVWNYGIEIHSEERKQIIREQQIERMKDPEYRANSMRNLKMENDNFKTKDHICEHCDMKLSKANYNRWHGKNCKIATVDNSSTVAGW